MFLTYSILLPKIIEYIFRFSKWQTMLSNTTILLDSREYPEGFVLVVAASPTEDICNIVEESNRCIKKDAIEDVHHLSIRIQPNSKETDYILGTMTVSGIYLLIFVISSLISAYMFRYEYHMFEDLTEMIRQKLIFKQKQETKRIKNLGMIIVGKEKGRQWLESALKQKELIEPNETNNVGLDLSEVLESDFFVDIDELDSYGIEDIKMSRLKRDLTIADLTKKINDPHETKSMYEKSDLHWVILIIISVYYSLPTIQMVLDSNNEYDDTGNQDLCFYNNLCQKPLGKIRDFNHLFSNLGYIVFGLLFNCLVFIRSRNLAALSDTGKKFDPHLHGVPQQTGIYYAMGCALIMEGVMSSCYHVCPATVTFQFDTTYMYLIAILMFLKLYQGRHPDVSCDAFKSYMGLGVALTLEVREFGC